MLVNASPAAGSAAKNLSIMFCLFRYAGFLVAAAPREAVLESPRTRQRKPLLSMYAKSLFFLYLPTVVFCYVDFVLRFVPRLHLAKTLAPVQNRTCVKRVCLKLFLLNLPAVRRMMTAPSAELKAAAHFWRPDYFCKTG